MKDMESQVKDIVEWKKKSQNSHKQEMLGLEKKIRRVREINFSGVQLKARRKRKHCQNNLARVVQATSFDICFLLYSVKGKNAKKKVNRLRFNFSI